MVGVAACLAAAACTPSTSTASDNTVAPTVSLVEPSSELNATSEPEPSGSATSQRLADLIVEAGWGIDSDNVLHGPAGLTVDLAACPARWSDSIGVDEDRIELVVVAPKGGNLGPLVQPHLDGFEAYLDMINQTGGLEGRKINVRWIDNSYVAGPDPIEAFGTNPPIPSTEPEPLAVLTYGTPTTLRAAELLGEACVPSVTPFGFGHSANHDPINHPWTWAGPLEYESETEIWLDAIDQRFATKPAKIVAVVMDNEFGLDVRDTFLAGADDRSSIGSIDVILHEPADPAPVVTVEDDTDVVLLLTAGDPCENLRDQLASFTGMKIMVSVCGRGPFAETADESDGWLFAPLTLSSVEHLLDPEITKIAEGALQTRGLDPTNTLTNRGFGLDGWLTVELLRTASALPGGLTRTNLLLAAWATATQDDWYQNVTLSD